MCVPKGETRYYPYYGLGSKSNGDSSNGENGNGNGNGNGVPPPVGLCLPIDDYVYLLMAVGVMYGCYKVRDFNVV